MKLVFNIITAISLYLTTLSPTLAASETISSDTFEQWQVSVAVDDFEGEIKPTLRSDIRNLNQKVIGSISISYFIVHNGYFNKALVTLRIPGKSNVWPDCDFEFTKYKIDNAKSEYFPDFGHACPSMYIDKAMALKLKRGHELKVSADGQTGIIDLSGFTKAWNTATQDFK